MYKIKIDGTERTKVSDDFPEGLKVYNGWIYYRSYYDGERLYKIRMDGSNKIQLTDIKATVESIIGDYIFYQVMDWNNACFVARIDGTLTRQFVPHIIHEKEPNDTLSTALELTPAQGFGNASTVLGHLEKTDVDFFKIKASASGYLNVVFASPSIGSNSVVTLMDINGHTIYSTKTRYDGLAIFSVKMKAGTAYYIKLSSPHGELIESGLYEMAAWFTPL